MIRTKAEDRIGTIVNGWKILEIARRNRKRTAIFKAQHVTSKVIIEDTYEHIQKRKTSKSKNSYIRDKRIRHIFDGMKTRCYNINSKSYSQYGIRGITICQEWLDNPRSFEEWALENGYREGLTIDRINIDGNYCPQNCRWIPSAENSKWTRNSYRIWVGIYCDTGQGWSLKVQRSRSWFGHILRNHNYDYAYQKLLDRIEELGGIKKVMGVSEEESDITQFLKDIENDCLEVEP